MMEGVPLNASNQQSGDSVTLLSQNVSHQPLGSCHQPLTTRASTSFFSTREEHEPAFAISDLVKPTLRSSLSLQGGSRLEGARRLSGHVPGTGAFHPVQPIAVQRNTEQFTNNTLTSVANGNHSFQNPPPGGIGEIAEDKRLSKRKL